jgi:hypothetical protein
MRSEFTPGQAYQYATTTLPVAIVSVIMAILFLTGESVACLAQKLDDDDDKVGPPYGYAGCRLPGEVDNEPLEPHFCAAYMNGTRWRNDAQWEVYATPCNKRQNMCQCQDRVVSNAALSATFILIASIQIFYLPFLRNQYTGDHVLRFDFHFTEQCMIASIGFGTLIALFAYASVQDSGFVRARSERESERI